MPIASWVESSNTAKGSLPSHPHALREHQWQFLGKHFKTAIESRRASTPIHSVLLGGVDHFRDDLIPAPARLKAGHGRMQSAGISHSVLFTGTHIARCWVYCLLRHTALCRVLCMARTPDRAELRYAMPIRACVSLTIGLQLFLIRHQPPPERHLSGFGLRGVSTEDTSIDFFCPGSFVGNTVLVLTAQNAALTYTHD